jgi:hypothetical protein
VITSEQVNEIASALAKAQKSIKGAVKDADNPFFKSKYADLASVREACYQQLADNGIAVVQTPSSDGARIAVTTRLMHTSGQWVQDTLTLTPKDDGPQAAGSAITYARRYALAAFVGVAPEDDDGERAEGRQDGKQVTPSKVATADGPQVVLASIDKVSDWKPTTNARVKRREFVLDDGKKLSVVNFPPDNEKLGELGAQLATEGDAVEVTYKHGKYGLDLRGLKRIKPVPPAEEPLKEQPL